MFIDSFAKKNHKDYWLEKTPVHSLYLKQILKDFPNAKTTAIKRNIIETINSSIKLENYNNLLKKKLGILKLIFHYVKYYKYIEHFYKKNQSLLIMVKYEDLKHSKKQVIRDLCNF